MLPRNNDLSSQCSTDVCIQRLTYLVEQVALFAKLLFRPVIDRSAVHQFDVRNPVHKQNAQDMTSPSVDVVRWLRTCLTRVAMIKLGDVGFRIFRGLLTGA